MVRVKSEDWKGGHPPAAAGGGRGRGPQGQHLGAGYAPGVRARRLLSRGREPHATFERGRGFTSLPVEFPLHDQPIGQKALVNVLGLRELDHGGQHGHHEPRRAASAHG